MDIKETWNHPKHFWMDDPPSDDLNPMCTHYDRKKEFGECSYEQTLQRIPETQETLTEDSFLSRPNSPQAEIYESNSDPSNITFETRSQETESNPSEKSSRASVESDEKWENVPLD